jgi:glycosyltransferase involved in cell wall biosynthesis
VSNYGKFSFIAALPHIDLSHMRVLDAVVESSPPDRDPGILTRASLQQGRFFVIASANRYEKNAYRALKALDKFFSDAGHRRDVAEFRVAVTGLTRDSRFVRLLGLRNPRRFAFVGYVSNGEKEELYASASALVYASISEGYGYPPVEAMRYETPSICAGGTSIPEICGDAAIYFNPYDIDEIVARLYEVLDPGARSDLVSRLAPRERLLRHRQMDALDELCVTIVGR